MNDPELPSIYVHLRPELHPDALLGLPGEIAVRSAEATGADVAACLLTALVMLGNAVGAEPHASTPDGAEHSARLFGVLVGETSAGRKGTAVNAVKRLFAEADPRWAHRIDGGLKSPERMIERVADRGDDSRLMLIEQEFARLLGIMTRTQFGPTLRKAWDGEALENGTRDPKTRLRASHPHISLLGSITPAELERFHVRLAQEGGMENRLLFCLSAPWPPVDWFDLEPDDFGDLIDRLRATIEMSRTSVLMQTDPMSRAIFLERGAGFQPSTVLPFHADVKPAWRDLKKGLVRPQSEHLASLSARAEAQVIRLAAAYAIGTVSEEITIEHIRAAIAMVNYCAGTVEVLFGVAAGQGAGSENRNRTRKLLDHLREHQDRRDGWVSRTEISQLFGNNLSRGDLRAVLAQPLASGWIESRRDADTGGGPRTEYRIVMPPDPYEKTK